MRFLNLNLELMELTKLNLEDKLDYGVHIFPIRYKEILQNLIFDYKCLFKGIFIEVNGQGNIVLD